MFVRIAMKECIKHGSLQMNFNKKCKTPRNYRVNAFLVIVWVGSSRFLNPVTWPILRYNDFLISHVNSRNLAAFGIFAFTWLHWRPLARKNIQNMVFEVKFHAEYDHIVRKIHKIIDNRYFTKYKVNLWDFYNLKYAIGAIKWIILIFSQFSAFF